MTTVPTGGGFFTSLTKNTATNDLLHFSLVTTQWQLKQIKSRYLAVIKSCVCQKLPSSIFTLLLLLSSFFGYKQTQQDTAAIAH